MNNRVQQRFDRGIREAVQAAAAATERAARRRDVTPARSTRRARPPKGRLYLDPATGATVWEPAPAKEGASK